MEDTEHGDFAKLSDAIINGSDSAKSGKYDKLFRAADEFGTYVSETLRDETEPDVLAPVFSSLAPRFSAEATGQMLMELLNHPLSLDQSKMDRDDKVFWTQVAAYIGPDWIESMRVRAAFMRVVDEFQPR